MKVVCFGFVLLTAVLFLGGMHFAQENGSSNPSSQESYRFVDIHSVLPKYEKYLKKKEKWQEDYRLMGAQLSKREEELYLKQRELAPLDKNSKEYYEQMLSIEMETLKLKREIELLNRKSEEERSALILSAYEDIRNTVSKYAQAKQLSAVFGVDSQFSSQGNLEEMMEQRRAILTRQVLFHDSSLDITLQIVKILNTE